MRYWCSKNGRDHIRVASWINVRPSCSQSVSNLVSVFSAKLLEIQGLSVLCLLHHELNEKHPEILAEEFTQTLSFPILLSFCLHSILFSVLFHLLSLFSLSFLQFLIGSMCVVPEQHFVEVTHSVFSPLAVQASSQFGGRRQRN